MIHFDEEEFKNLRQHVEELSLNEEKNIRVSDARMKKTVLKKRVQRECERDKRDDKRKYQLLIGSVIIELSS